jgi:hypothetical protein
MRRPHPPGGRHAPPLVARTSLWLRCLSSPAARGPRESFPVVYHACRDPQPPVVQIVASEGRGPGVGCRRVCSHEKGALISCPRATNGNHAGFAGAETRPAAGAMNLAPASPPKSAGFCGYPPEIHVPYQQVVPRKLPCCGAISLRESRAFVTFGLPQRGRKKPGRVAKGLRARCGAVTGLRNRAATERGRAGRERRRLTMPKPPGRQGRSESGRPLGSGSGDLRRGVFG